MPLPEDLNASASTADTSTTSFSTDSSSGSASISDANPGSSSTPETGAKEPPDLLSAVRSAVDGTKADAASPSAGQNGTSTQVDPKNPQGGMDPSAAAKENTEEDTRFDKHPRFKKLLTERDSFKSEATEYRNVTAYMKENGLAASEVAEGFKIMAAMKNNPVQALKDLTVYVDRLRQFAGDALTPDLQQQVDQGRITPEMAKELAAARNQAQFLQHRSSLTAQQQQQQVAEHQAAQQAQALQGAVNQWVQSQQAKDADFAHKQKQLEWAARSYMANNPPRTAAEATAMMQKCYDEVNAEFSKLTPRRPALKPLQSASSSSGAQPQPKTLKEAIALSLHAT